MLHGMYNTVHNIGVKKYNKIEIEQKYTSKCMSK